MRDFENQDLTIGKSQKEKGEVVVEREPVDAEYHKKAEQAEIERLRESIHKNYIPTKAKIESDLNQPNEESKRINALASDEHNQGELNAESMPFRKSIAFRNAKDSEFRYRKLYSGWKKFGTRKMEKKKEVYRAAQNVATPEPDLMSRPKLGVFGKIKKFFSEDDKSEAA